MKRIFLSVSFLLALAIVGIAEDGFYVNIKERTESYTWFTGENIPAK